VRGIVVSVQFDDLLAVTLHRNICHLEECLVVTSPQDLRTQELVKTIPHARCYVTDAFYRSGAAFNKGCALQEGLTELGQSGWILIWDADILFPNPMNLPKLEIGKLYSPRRRILSDPTRWHHGFDWELAVPSHDKAFQGYFQLFHADDPVLTNKLWYSPMFNHAGGADGLFQSKWKEQDKIRPLFDVLHLGPRDRDWHGRISPRLDGELIEGAEERQVQMQAFHDYKGWNKERRKIKNAYQEHIETTKPS